MELSVHSHARPLYVVLKGGLLNSPEMSAPHFSVIVATVRSFALKVSVKLVRS